MEQWAMLVWLAGAVPVAYGPYTSQSAAEAALTAYTSGTDNFENQGGSVGAAQIIPLYPPTAIPNQPL
jgi:hypothetical protein